MARGRKPRPDINCLRCSSAFRPKRRESKYCCLECAIKAKPPQSYLRGPRHRLWKGGTRPTKYDSVKVMARWKVRYALRKGEISKAPCEVCGSLKSEAHHPDYSKPLSIEWLCRKHHRQADYRDGTKKGDFGQ